jgi:DNA polymerase-3 subunit delta
MPKGQSYLYVGPEVGERRDAVDALRTAFAKKLGAAPEEHSCYASEGRLPELVSTLMNGSLFASARFAQLKDADQIKKKDEVDLLAAYLAAPADDTVLVLTADSTAVDKRLEAAFPKENKRIFWELFEDRKADWVAGFFKRAGFRIAADGVDAILETVENNTDAFRRECGRLALFYEPGSLIDAAAVERCLERGREESAFSLFGALADGDAAKALAIGRSLLAAKEAPPQILAGLGWSFRRLADYLELAASGRLNDFELRKAGFASKKAQAEYARAGRRYDAAAVDRFLALIAEYDVEFRSAGAALEAALFDIFLMKLAAPVPRCR